MNDKQLENLLDIIEDKKGNRKFTETIFKKYRPKKEIGLEIIKKIQQFTDKNNLFYLSENNKSVGLISLSQSLVSLSYLSQYEVDFSQNKDYANLLTKNLTAFFQEIGYFEDPTTLKFRATPFLSTNDNYVDSVAKSLQASMEIREMLYLAIEQGSPINITIEGIGGDKEILKALTKVIKICISTLSDLAIPCQNNPKVFELEDGEVSIPCEYKGWNYTGIKGLDVNDSRAKSFEPSMYFTYSVSMAYISIYENIISVLNYRRGLDELNKKYDGLKADIKNSGDYDIDEKLVALEEERKAEIASLYPSEDLEKFQRDNEFYDEIYSEYIRLRRIEKGVGYFFDRKLDNIDIKSYFVGLDYNAIEFQDIIGSTTNNALFNVLFLIIILIASGVADDYTMYQPNERYFEWLQSAMQNIYDGYCDLEKTRKLYIIEQYILNFNESLPDELLDEANSLRKQHIQMLSIVPIMVRAYNLVCQYLIQYPQKQMINYLELIMTNRRQTPSGKKEWCWDKDSYDINVNTLFISSLFDFYTYYEQYEEPYISTEEAIATEKKKVAKAIEKNTNEKEKAIKTFEQEKEEIQKKAEEEINKAKEEKENSLIVKGVKELVRQVLEEELIDFLPSAFDKISDYLCHRQTDMTPQNKDDAIDPKYTREKAAALELQKLIASFYVRRIIACNRDKVERVELAPGMNFDDYEKMLDSGDGLIKDKNYERCLAEVIDTLGKTIINDR